jgi:hypothetical protein
MMLCTAEVSSILSFSPRNSVYFLTLPPCSKVLRNNDIEVGVHIADVTHFLPQNSALDKEAAERGTTFYLVDRRFDMLPSLLSSGK